MRRFTVGRGVLLEDAALVDEWFEFGHRTNYVQGCLKAGYAKPFLAVYSSAGDFSAASSVN
jgi:hypothetical protein